MHAHFDAKPFRFDRLAAEVRVRCLPGSLDTEATLERIAVAQKFLEGVRLRS